MSRSQNSRTGGLKNANRIALVMGTALASAALAGCSTSAAPRAEASFSKAQIALQKGQVSKAITHAEAAVLAEPRNATFRSTLGAAYLEAGRFQSAATSFEDAIQLGDENARTVLSFALAKIAIGDNVSALSQLENNQGAINPADYGLAIALAGKPEAGTHVLMNTLRSGQNTAKVRQNLAYAYALAGNWRAARVMAAEDVPADQLDGRLSGWAASAQPEAFQTRVAQLLQVAAVRDGGQPQHLALVNFPSSEQMIADAAASVPAEQADASAEPSDREALAFKLASETTSAPAKVRSKTLDPTVAGILAATSQSAAKPAVKPAAKPVAQPAVQPAKEPARASSARFVSNPVVQKVPVAASSAAPKRVAKAPARAPQAAPKPSSQRRMAYAKPKADTHLVQLGSFSSRAEAERGWKVAQSKFPQLKAHDVVITRAEVKGKTFFRVAAAGFGQSTARSMCRTVKASGRGCFAYAASNPPAGAVDRGVRIAARTR